MEHYAEVILPMALPQYFTYRVPLLLMPEMAPGKRVVVQFGSRKLYTALVHHLHQEKPRDVKPKDILDVEDEHPIVTSHQFALWEWMAGYYCCTLGEVMAAALPAGLKLESTMMIRRNHLQEIRDEDLNDEEYLVMEALESQERLSIQEVGKITNRANPLRIIKELIGKHYLLLEEELRQGYRPRRHKMVRLGPKAQGDALEQAFAQLEKAPRQRELFLQFFKLSPQGEAAVPAAKLLKNTGATHATLKSLAKKGWLESFEQGDTEPNLLTAGQEGPPTLSPAQEQALQEIQQHHQAKKTVLLHGVTGSGKTELYVHLAESHLAAGRHVLYLVPEIALTTQLIQRMKRYFGERVLVYHSRYSDRERVESWQALQQDEAPRLVIGARSCLFLPLRRLGLVIIDEEHERSYKQQNPAPRYHARDTALWLAQQQGALALLGSATPSLESYHHAQSGKYGLVALHQRYGDTPLPQIDCVDLKEARKRKQLNGPFSEVLQHHIEETLQRDEQVILFQNRRGFSTPIQCQTCGEVIQCRHCDISLTYHRHSDLLRCHYCGYSRQLPKNCPSCGSHELRNLGHGTEKLEEDLRLMYPQAEVQRLDLDSTRKKHAFEKIINDLEEGLTDIVVGTQMVTKGLDFGKVALVGIMNADALLHFPDFRSQERAFQLLSQVAGRAGRRTRRGLVLIQTSSPRHPVLQQVMRYDYPGFFERELADRKGYAYPPFARLIKITTQHRDREHLHYRSQRYAEMLRAQFGARLLGPEFPLVARLRNRYHMEMLIKLEPKISLPRAKKRLLAITEKFERAYPQQRIRINLDVDPS